MPTKLKDQRIRPYVVRIDVTAYVVRATDGKDAYQRAVKDIARGGMTAAVKPIGKNFGATLA